MYPLVDLVDLLYDLKVLMSRVAHIEGLDLESVEFGDREMTVLDWARLNVDALNDLIKDEALIGFVAAN